MAKNFVTMPLGFAGQRALEELGLPFRLLKRLNTLGFVLAGSSAAYVLAQIHGIEIAKPGDFDFFYKGRTLKGLPMSPAEFNQLEGFEEVRPCRTDVANRCLSDEGLTLQHTSPYAFSFAGETETVDCVGPFRYQQNPDPSTEPWLENAYTPTAPATRKHSIRVQLITGADRDFIRYGTFQARVLDTLETITKTQGKKAAETAFNLLGAAFGWNPEGDPRWLETGKRWASRARDDEKAVPVWCRFDFSVTCVEIDGDQIVFHPSALEDLKAKRLRISNKGRHPVKLLRRIHKYQKKGFEFPVTELSKLMEMSWNLSDEDREQLVQLNQGLLQADEAGTDANWLDLTGHQYQEIGESMATVLRSVSEIERHSSEMDLEGNGYLHHERPYRLEGALFSWVLDFAAKDNGYLTFFL